MTEDPRENIENWIPSQKLHEKRRSLVTKRRAETLAWERATNGLGELGAYKKIRNRLYICLPLFDQWFLAHSDNAAA